LTPFGVTTMEKMKRQVDRSRVVPRVRRKARAKVTAAYHEAGSVKRTRAVQQRAVDTQHRIIDAAIKEFSQHGFEGSSVRRVAKNAGLKQALITYHFKTKDRLWRACLAQCVESFSARFQSRLHGLRGVDNTVKLQIMLDEFIRFTVDNIDFHRLMADVASKPSPQLAWLVDKYLKDIFKMWVDLIQQAQQAGQFVKGDPYHLLYIFIGAVSRLFLLAAEVKLITGRSAFDQAYIDEHIEICLNLFFKNN
jgi:TetR/AcrR family transcriptional regulator